MTVQKLLDAAGVAPDAISGNVEISDLVADSRRARPGSLFVCMPSASSDSHRFLNAAAQAGATAAIAHTREGFEMARAAMDCAVLASNERGRFHDALWRIAKAFFSNPSGSMIVAGVTGTNGKTTTCWMLRDMFSALGEPSGYLGTLGIRYPGTERELENTTPFPIELNRLLAEIRDAHVRFLAMEVSSHALQERRSDGVEFDAGIFTNLTQDHLDYHGTMEAYEAAKRRFFEDLPSQSSKRFVAALNVDDPVGARLADGLACEKLTYGVRSGMLRGEAVSVSVDHLKVRLAWQGESLEASVGLGGHFNVMNCLSAVAGCLALGKSLAEAGAGLSAVRPVPGRFESVPNRHGIGVIVDYAHTPDALVKLLEAARAIDHQRLITVFGCGGDRDKGKRPKMARAVSERADLTVVTSDNPRTEDPQAILKDVSAGIVQGRASVSVVDRREAIAYALTEARPGDIVVIAGKGHENYQIVGRTKQPMDDRLMAREALEARQ